MLPPNVYHTGHIYSDTICKAFAEGCGGALVSPAPLLPGSVAMYGCLRGLLPTLKQAQAEGRTWWYMDNGYFRPGHFHGYYRVTRNAFQHDGTGKASSKRWERLGLNIAPWQKGGRRILVCPPSQKFGELLGFNAAAWLQAMLNTLKRHTDREIRVRAKKGNATPLDADLKDCHAVVAHSSNAAVLALLAGVPVFCTAPCAAHRMGGADVSKIEMPVYPEDREQWAWNLADHQFNLEEMRQGLCWEMLQEEIECPA